MTHKICKKCGILKEISEFYKMPRAKDGTRNECKTCVREQAKQHQISKGGDYMRNIHLRRNFNINLEEYRELLKKQDYKCLICGIDRKDVDIDFAVDHNHVTGRIRGLLCRTCNTGLGHFKDDITLLYKAIKYLSKNDSKEIAKKCDFLKN